MTFEITSGETNETKTVDEKEIGKDDDNASIPLVPVLKGKSDRGRSGGRDKDPSFNDTWSVKSLDNPLPSRGPIFYKTNDERRGFGSGDVGWKPLPKFAIWTTERNNRRPDQPVYHHHQGGIFLSFLNSVDQKNPSRST